MRIIGLLLLLVALAPRGGLALRRPALRMLWGQPGLNNDLTRNWVKDEAGASVRWPSDPSTPLRSVIHFTGGFLVGAAPVLAYNDLLEFLSARGHIIVATPIPLISLNHGEVAAACLERFNAAYARLLKQEDRPAVPSAVIGMGHSLGGKLTALMGCLLGSDQRSPRRVGQIFMAFNNFGRGQTSAPAGSGSAGAGAGTGAGAGPEFVPSPADTWSQIASSNQVPRSIMLRFGSDALDQSEPLAKVLLSSEPLAKVLLSSEPLAKVLLSSAQSSTVDSPAPSQDTDALVVEEEAAAARRVLLWSLTGSHLSPNLPDPLLSSEAWYELLDNGLAQAAGAAAWGDLGDLKCSVRVGLGVGGGLRARLGRRVGERESSRCRELL